VALDADPERTVRFKVSRDPSERDSASDAGKSELGGTSGTGDAGKSEFGTRGTGDASDPGDAHSGGVGDPGDPR
jgi:hypothetical protein